MRILHSELEYKPVKQNKAMLNKLPLPIVKWFRKMKMDKLVSYVSGVYGCEDLYVRLISGETMFWRLRGRYYLLCYDGCAERDIKAIKLFERDLVAMARVSADKILAGVDLETKQDFTQEN